MAITNYDRVGKALELLTCGLKPFLTASALGKEQDASAETVRIGLAGAGLVAGGNSVAIRPRCQSRSASDHAGESLACEGRVGNRGQA